MPNNEANCVLEQVVDGELITLHPVTKAECVQGLSERIGTEIQPTVQNLQTNINTKADSSALTTTDSRVENLQQQVNNIARLPEGSTTGDAEIVQARVGVDATNYINLKTRLDTEMNSVKEDITKINGCSHKLLYSRKSNFTSGRIIPASGNVGVSETSKVTDFIAVDYEKEYIVSLPRVPSSGAAGYAFYDADKRYINGYSYMATTDGTIKTARTTIVPKNISSSLVNAKYVRFGTYDSDNFYFYEKTEYGTTMASIRNPIQENGEHKRVPYITDPELSERRVLAGPYSSCDGEKIVVNVGEDYAFLWKGCYDEDGADLGTITGDFLYDGAVISTPRPYIYLYMFNKSTSKNVALDEIKEKLIIKEFYDKVFLNTKSLLNKDKDNSEKTIVGFGDSQLQFTNMPVLVGNKIGCKAHNIGLASTRLSSYKTVLRRNLSFAMLAKSIATGDFTAQTTDSLYNDPTSTVKGIIDDLMSIDFSKVDYVIVSYGTNDYYSGVPLGTVSDESIPASSASGDESTFLGSLNYGIKTLLNAYPNLKILVLTPVYRALISGDIQQSCEEWQNAQGLYLKDYADALVSGSEHNNIPCRNIYAESGVNRYNWRQYIRSDGTHWLQGYGDNYFTDMVCAAFRDMYNFY